MWCAHTSLASGTSSSDSAPAAAGRAAGELALLLLLLLLLPTALASANRGTSSSLPDAAADRCDPRGALRSRGVGAGQMGARATRRLHTGAMPQACAVNAMIVMSIC